MLCRRADYGFKLLAGVDIIICDIARFNCAVGSGKPNAWDPYDGFEYVTSFRIVWQCKREQDCVAEAFLASQIAPVHLSRQVSEKCEPRCRQADGASVRSHLG